MIAGGRAGRPLRPPTEIGPDRDARRPNGVVDVRRPRTRAEGRVAVDEDGLMGYFPGLDRTGPGAGSNAGCAKAWCPRRASGGARYTRWGPIIETLADQDSVTFLRESFGSRGWSPRAGCASRGGPAGRDRQQHDGDGPGAVNERRGPRKAARFHPALRRLRPSRSSSLVDTPGYMVGPDAESEGARAPGLTRLLVAGACRACALPGGRSAPRLTGLGAQGDDGRGAPTSRC